jgi:putative endonuclease
MWHVYIIRCKNNKLYTGITNSIERRLAKHNSGKGGRFTRSWKPVKLIYTKKVRNRSSALKREAAIKKLSRSEKLDLVKK